jgi:hypothetical protein
MTVTRRFGTLFGVLCLTMCTAVCGQSAEQVRSYQEFEAAKAANQVPQALAAGERALRLAQAGGVDTPVQIDLLRRPVKARRPSATTSRHSRCRRPIWAPTTRIW